MAWPLPVWPAVADKSSLVVELIQPGQASTCFSASWATDERPWATPNSPAARRSWHPGQMTPADDPPVSEPTAESTAGSPPAPEPDGGEDEQHRLFREALERKKSESHASAGGAAEGGHGAIGRGASAKTQRMFRRKSG